MRVKITVLVSVAIIVCIALLSIVGVRAIDTTNTESAVTIMNLTCSDATVELNERFLQVEYNLSAMESYILEDVPDANAVDADYSVFEEHLESVKTTFSALVSANQGVVAYYYRYRPETYPTSGGMFMVDVDRDGTFADVDVTDITRYDKDDVEHVGWYYIPVSTGEATWMEPYWNANNDTYTLSYVVPLKDESGRTFGVIGVDFDLNQIIDDLSKVNAYQTGSASLISADGTVISSSVLEDGTDLRSQGADLATIADKLENESSEGEMYSYTHDGVTYAFTFCSLRNGMRLGLSVPRTEIDTSRTSAVIQLVALSSWILASAIVITFVAIGRTMRPLSQLTSVARKIGEGDPDVTFPENARGEIGVLNETMQRMNEQVKQLVDGLSTKAYRDALTGVRNTSAFEDEVASYDEGTTKFALVMFDVNYLKTVNDTYGHDKGDIYLKNACHLICEVFKHSPVFRIGGDEFVAILREDQADQADELMARLDEEAARVSAQAKNPWERVDVARGAAVFDPATSPYTSAPVIQTRRAADEAMYENKGEKRR